MTIFCENCDKKVSEEDIFQDEFCSEECFREFLLDPEFWSGGTNYKEPIDNSMGNDGVEEYEERKRQRIAELNEY